MSEFFDFPKELRCDSVLLEKTHPYTSNMLERAASEIERLSRELGAARAEVARTQGDWSRLLHDAEAERDHWYALVSRADRAQFPYYPAPISKERA
jgi:hypothetical protein